MMETTAVAEGETMVVAFDPTEDEQVSAVRAVNRIVNPILSRLWMLPVGVMALALTIAASNGALVDFLLDDSFWIFVVMWTVIPIWASRIPRRQVRRQRRELASAGGTATTLELSPWGCRTRWANGENGVTWAGMVRAVETAEHYLVFYSKQCAYYVPRRALTGPEDARFRRLLKTHMGERSAIAA